MSEPRKNRSMDMTHIFQAIYDENTESIKVELLPLDLAINLDHGSGDSIMSVPQSSIQTEGEADCKHIKTICLYGTGTVSVSPSDEGDDFHQIECIELQPKSICARRIKLVGSGKLVMQSV